MTVDTTYQRNPALPVSIVDDELLVLDPGTARYFVLDPVGRRIWDLLEMPKSVEQLCAGLSREYDGASAQIVADVAAFLAQLVDRKILILSPDDGSGREST